MYTHTSFLVIMYELNSLTLEVNCSIMLMNPIKNHIHSLSDITDLDNMRYVHNDLDNMRYVHKADDNNVHMHKMQKITMPIR